MSLSFVQQVEGARPTDIGHQQIVQKDLSYLNTAIGAVDTAIEGAGIVRESVGKQKAKDIVQEAQMQVDQEVAESEELAKITSLGSKAGLEDLLKKTKLLEKGVAQGKITRENARLRVANLVTKGIEENPFTADIIRQSATEMLGFNPQSEAVRQFFGAFEPAGTTSPSSKLEKDAAAISLATGKTINESKKLLGRRLALQAKADIDKLEYEAGVKTTSDYIANTLSATSAGASERFQTSLLAIKKSGGDISKDAMKAQVLSDKLSVKNAILTEVRKNKGTTSPEMIANLDSQLDTIYGDYIEIAESSDSLDSAIRELSLYDTMTQLGVVEVAPEIRRGKLILGERGLSTYMDLVAAAGGDEQQLKSLFKMSPLLAEAHSLLTDEEKTKGFPKVIHGVMTKLYDGTIKNPDGTANTTDAEVKVIDGLQQSLANDKADPETRDQIRKLFEDNGLGARASQVVLGARASLATPEQKAYIKNKWNTLSGRSISDLISQITEDSNKSLVIEATPQGLKVTRRKMSPAGLVRVPATGHDAYDTATAINQYLQATSRGWGDVLNITDPAKLANDIATKVNDALNKQATEKKLKEEAEAKAEADRKQQREEAVTTSQTSAVDLRTITSDDGSIDLEALKELDHKRYDRLMRKARERAGEK